MNGTPREVLEFAKSKGVEFVDIKFIDFPGRWQHFTIPASRLSEETVRRRHPLRRLEHPRLEEHQRERHARDSRRLHRLHGSVLLPSDPERHRGHPRSDHAGTVRARSAVHRAEGRAASREHGHRRSRLLRARGRVLHPRRRALRAGRTQRLLRRSIPIEGVWNSGRDEGPNLAYKSRLKEGYFPVPPTDSLQDLRSEIVKNLTACGLACEVQHHEVATAGRARSGSGSTRSCGWATRCRSSSTS